MTEKKWKQEKCITKNNNYESTHTWICVLFLIRNYNFLNLICEMQVFVQNVTDSVTGEMYNDAIDDRKLLFREVYIWQKINRQNVQ